MSLSTLFQRFRLPLGRRPGAEPVVNTPADVEAARTLARRRLIGMLVLVGAGMVVFPMVLETKPRPVAADVTMRSATTPAELVAGAPSAAGAVRVAPAPQTAPAPAQVIPPAVVGDAAQDDAAPAPAPEPVRPAAAVPTKVPAKPASNVVAAPVPTEKPAPKPVAKPTDAVTGERYVVQFGAFADPKSARDARMKLERLGIKTYAQQVDTPDGKRTRVRMGPYNNRAEADKALGALRKAGLDGKVLTL